MCCIYGVHVPCVYETPCPFCVGGNTTTKPEVILFNSLTIAMEIVPIEMMYMTVHVV